VPGQLWSNSETSIRLLRTSTRRVPARTTRLARAPSAGEMQRTSRSMSARSPCFRAQTACSTLPRGRCRSLFSSVSPAKAAMRHASCTMGWQPFLEHLLQRLSPAFLKLHRAHVAQLRVQPLVVVPPHLSAKLHLKVAEVLEALVVDKLSLERLVALLIYGTVVRCSPSYTAASLSRETMINPAR